MDFEKFLVVYLILFAVVAVAAIGLAMENHKLEKENKRMKKILIWRGEK